MQRDHDDGFEVLDLGGPGDAERDSSPLQLDESPTPIGHRPEGSGGAAPVSWRRWVAAGILFALGVGAGGYVLAARHNTAEQAAQAGQVDLVVGAVSGGGGGEEVENFRVAVHNVGPRDVELISIVPQGWVLPPASREPSTLPAAEWTNVFMRATVDCESDPPTGLDARVRTEAGEVAVTVAMPPGSDALVPSRELACSDEFAGYGFRVQVSELPPLSDAEVVRMDVGLSPLTPGEDFTVTGVVVTAAGFTADVLDLPLEFASTRRSLNELELVWRPADCDQTHLFDEITLRLEIARADGGTHTEAVTLPARAVAILARTGYSYCDG